MNSSKHFSCSTLNLKDYTTKDAMKYSSFNVVLLLFFFFFLLLYLFIICLCLWLKLYFHNKIPPTFTENIDGYRGRLIPLMDNTKNSLIITAFEKKKGKKGQNNTNRQQPGRPAAFSGHSLSQQGWPIIASLRKGGQVPRRFPLCQFLTVTALFELPQRMCVAKVFQRRLAIIGCFRPPGTNGGGGE